MSTDLLPENFPDPATTRDLAKLLGVHSTAITRAVNTEPTFPRPFRVSTAKNSRMRFRRSDIAEWLANQLNRG